MIIRCPQKARKIHRKSLILNDISSMAFSRKGVLWKVKPDRDRKTHNVIKLGILDSRTCAAET